MTRLTWFILLMIMVSFTACGSNSTTETISESKSDIKVIKVHKEKLSGLSREYSISLQNFGNSPGRIISWIVELEDGQIINSKRGASRTAYMYKYHEYYSDDKEFDVLAPNEKSRFVLFTGISSIKEFFFSVEILEEDGAVHTVVYFTTIR